ncbi:MAG: ribosome small subunit-dependent GTPase A [Chryseobacterium sp.]|nr:MAG: ribosome small subunit-dependent GTPase A [Chryseobacterium sp.]
MERHGLVIKSTGSWYRVMDLSSNEVFEARIRGKFKLLKMRLTNPLAVGDRVGFKLEKDDIAWITKIEPRRNYLIRKSVNLSKEAHIIASNIDVACFVFTLKMPETSLGFLDRFLASCEAYDISALILFNKMDLADEKDRQYISDLKTVYENIGYKSLEVSATAGVNLVELQNLLKNKTSVFFGHSGSGKSTLVNALSPGINLRTGNISDVHLKGKHTTTFAEMHFWPFGGAVIDTPGVREFAMIDVKPEEIQHFFPEIFRTAENCRYNNCLHLTEPRCAVRPAVEEGDILQTRYETYLKLMEEAEEQQLY